MKKITIFCIASLFCTSFAQDTTSVPVDTRGIYQNTKLSVVCKSKLPNGQEITANIPVLYTKNSMFVKAADVEKISKLKTEIEIYIKESEALKKKGDELGKKWALIVKETQPTEALLK